MVRPSDAQVSLSHKQIAHWADDQACPCGEVRDPARELWDWSWVGCDNCEQYWHSDCAELRENQGVIPETLSFVCRKCKPQKRRGSTQEPEPAPALLPTLPIPEPIPFESMPLEPIVAPITPIVIAEPPKPEPVSATPKILRISLGGTKKAANTVTPVSTPLNSVVGSTPRPHIIPASPALASSSLGAERTVAVRTDKRGEFWLCRVVEDRGAQLVVEWYDSPRRHQYVLTSRRDLVSLASVVDNAVPLQSLPHSVFALTAGQAADLAALATHAYSSTVSERPTPRPTIVRAPAPAPAPPIYVEAPPPPALTYATLMQSLEKRSYPSEGEVLIELEAAELTLDYLEVVGFINPLIVRDSAELAQWPERPLAETLCQQDVTEVVPHDCRAGPQVPVDTTWPLATWLQHLQSPLAGDERVLKAEVELRGNQAFPAPKLVAQIDWAQLFTTPALQFPQASAKFCQMMSAGAYNDFKVESRGFSSWNYVQSGEAHYYLVDSPLATLDKGFINKGLFSFTGYRLGDGKSISPLWTLDYCAYRPPGGKYDLGYGVRRWRVVVKAGQTLVIPSGWIYAMHSPVTSVVFGGRFLNHYSLRQQAYIHEQEKLPQVNGIYWYAAANLLATFQTSLDRALANGTAAHGQPEWLTTALTELLQCLGRQQGKEPFPPAGVGAYDSSKRLLEDLKRHAALRPNKRG